MNPVAACLITALFSIALLRGEDSPIADSLAGYSVEQGKQGWSYLYYLSSKDGTGTYVPEDAQPMKWGAKSGDTKDLWNAPFTYFTLGPESAKSRVIEGGYQGWAVRRWTSDHDGEIEITGSVKCTAKPGDAESAGDGIGLKIFVGGKELLNKLLAPQESVEIQLRTPVHRGSKLDFAVTPGPALNALFDGSQFHVVIEKAK
jgi:hypothetical protein